MFISLLLSVFYFSFLRAPNRTTRSRKSWTKLTTTGAHSGNEERVGHRCADRSFFPFKSQLYWLPLLHLFQLFQTKNTTSSRCHLLGELEHRSLPCERCLSELTLLAAKKNSSRLSKKELFEIENVAQHEVDTESCCVEIDGQTWHHIKLEKDPALRKRHVNRLRTYVNGYFKLDVRTTSDLRWRFLV